MISRAGDVFADTLNSMSSLPNAPTRMTTSFAFSFIERCLKECLATRQFGKREMMRILADSFGERVECVYCGSLDVGRWDHLFPVASGGDTVIGNMVLACRRCDDSKRDLPYATWMYSDSPLSPKKREVVDLEDRLLRLEAYRALHNYAPKPIEGRLLPEELERLAAIRAKLNELKAEINSLIADVQSKEVTGEKTRVSGGVI